MAKLPLSRFPPGPQDIISPAGEPRKIWYSTFHHIRTTPVAPVNSRPRRLAKTASVSRKSSWWRCFKKAPPTRPPPSQPVPKIEGGDGPCVDYHAINASTFRNQHPVRYIAYLTYQLPGRQDFSTVYLLMVYHQFKLIPTNSQDEAFQSSLVPVYVLGRRNVAQCLQRSSIKSLRPGFLSIINP